MVLTNRTMGHESSCKDLIKNTEILGEVHNPSMSGRNYNGKTKPVREGGGEAPSLGALLAQSLGRLFPSGHPHH